MIKPYTIILGATGSIGESALDVLRQYKKIRVAGLVNYSNKELLNISKEFNCKNCLMRAESDITLNCFISKIVDEYGSENLTALNAISGFNGLEASIILAKYGIETLLANKETIVAGGKVFLDYAKKQKCKIVPVDSEHSAIYSLKKAHKNIKNVIITASGGPFRDKTKGFDNIKVEDAIRHPNWKMGEKISIDSATLANKVLECIEAKYLFGLKNESIKVVIHPQSIVHSLVELKNGSIYAEISTPDMRLAISKAYGLLKEAFIKRLDFSSLNLDFYTPVAEQLKFLKLKDAALTNSRNSIVFNASNEICVDAFRKKTIKFTQIQKIVEKCLFDADKIYNNTKISSFDEIYFCDEVVRKWTTNLINHS